MSCATITLIHDSFIATGNFLEYDVAEGWEPLCHFLDVPVPDEEFPSGNVAADYHKRVEDCMKPRFLRSIRNLVLISTAVIGSGCYVYCQDAPGMKSWIS